MLTLTIMPADFSDPSLRTFLKAHLADMAPTAPPESQHALDYDALQRPGVRLWTAVVDGATVGTIALAELEPGHEELKSMRTDPAMRGRGIASELLRFALDDARARGASRISLETGSMDFFAAAHRLYARHGFVETDPFGSYTPDPLSTFMTRTLAAA